MQHARILLRALLHGGDLLIAHVFEAVKVVQRKEVCQAVRLCALQRAAVLHEDIARITDHLREQFGRVLVGIVNPHRLKRPALRQVHLGIADSAQRPRRITQRFLVVYGGGIQRADARPEPERSKPLGAGGGRQPVDAKQAANAQDAGKYPDNTTPGQKAGRRFLDMPCQRFSVFRRIAEEALRRSGAFVEFVLLFLRVFQVGIEPIDTAVDGQDGLGHGIKLRA